MTTPFAGFYLIPMVFSPKRWYGDETLGFGWAFCIHDTNPCK